MNWIVVNQNTRIVVSSWPTEQLARWDKAERDAKYAMDEPPELSPLVVEEEAI